MEKAADALQDTWLFGGTIWENIAYSKEQATKEKVRSAAGAASDHCRAILADPAILILDEATSSVDTRTELEIQKAMDALMKDGTSQSVDKVAAL